MQLPYSENIEIQYLITEIPDKTFHNCVKLKTYALLNFPNFINLSRIGENIAST